LAYYNPLFSSKEVMEKVLYGNPYDTSQVIHLLLQYEQRWKTGDPFSAFAVFLHDGTFVGHVSLHALQEGGTAELGYILHKQFWGKGYGTEMVEAVITQFAKQLYKREYKVEGVKFKEIIATVRVDNTASIKILGRFFKEKGELFKYGAARKCFSLELGNTCLIEPQ